MRPMLATKGDYVPLGEEWVHEVKWDGVRIVADVTTDAPVARLWSRNANDVTIAWPDVAPSPLGARDLLVDGEIIALNDKGLPDFRVLMERMHVRSAVTARRMAGTVPATFMVFDLLRLDGRDITHESLAHRRERLLGLGLDGVWQVPTSYDDGRMLLEATRQQGLEGIVSKRRSSRYTPGMRTPYWLKFAHRESSSYVVGGWRPQQGTSDRLAALLVGTPTPQGLRYRGRVGSGIGPKAAAVLSRLLEPLARDTNPFDEEVPREDITGTHWVEPLLVIDVDSHRTVLDDRLRQPSYRGVRSDLGAIDLMVTD